MADKAAAAAGNKTRQRRRRCSRPQPEKLSKWTPHSAGTPVVSSERPWCCRQRPIHLCTPSRWRKPAVYCAYLDIGPILHNIEASYVFAGPHSVVPEKPLQIVRRGGLRPSISPSIQTGQLPNSAASLFFPTGRNRINQATTRCGSHSPPQGNTIPDGAQSAWCFPLFNPRRTP